MKYLEIDYIKQHSHIDFDCDDALLELYGESAEDTIAQYLGRGKTVDECVASLEEEYGRIPPAVRHAALLLVDISYTHQSAVTSQNLSMVPCGNLDFLLRPFMKL